MGGGVGDDWITEGQHRRCVGGTEDQDRPWAGCRGLWALVLNRRLLPGGAPSLGQILALGDGPPHLFSALSCMPVPPPPPRERWLPFSWILLTSGINTPEMIPHPESWQWLA